MSMERQCVVYDTLPFCDIIGSVHSALLHELSLDILVS